MKIELAIVLFCLLSLATGTVIPRVGPIDSHAPISYKVQIEDPPLTRWAPIIRDFNQSIHRFVEFLELIPIPEDFYEGV